jgi:hypothetical protein
VLSDNPLNLISLAIYIRRCPGGGSVKEDATCESAKAILGMTGLTERETIIFNRFSPSFVDEAEIVEVVGRECWPWKLIGFETTPQLTCTCNRPTPSDNILAATIDK